jgi:hypothetical protein
LKDVNVTVKPDPTLAATGYNYDVIVDGVLNGTVSSLRTHDLDGSGFSFYEQGFSTGSTPYTGGLPTDRKVISTTGTIYQFQPYNPNNALRLGSGQSGTLTFTTPTKVAGLKMAVTSGGATLNYTVHYSDATTGTGSVSVNDWGCAGCSNYAVANLGRTDNSGFESAIWAVYENDITVDANKTVSSVDFTSSGSWTAIFGMSQVFSAVAAPTLSLSGNQTITVDNTTIYATPVWASGHTGTVAWTKISGPGATTITPSGYNATVSNLQTGTYVFRCTATQDDSQTAYAEVTIDVTIPPVITPSGNSLFLRIKTKLVNN